ncbi:hypothetical protein [Sinorhizobium meliloti]|uniref:hypothetical protein n=1 Tax=Rhizobium meliloti TaxID=382 RepID=UPI000FD89063|nr:hypothetical protein [Sinorhizobium meliloti]RVN35037.1 hypothetical protein CN111_27295 [Sinorhizobium meliloti]RVQ11409.1 hypothetical protein CN067_32130 [Sinorhizobium meliloti]RVQ24207.1 hypothetical protein CN062_30685 [Sinorhizobium meliloti]RVQ53975.1 hypothetical protein CN060_25060 [Sinorhizobium meliloti]
MRYSSPISRVACDAETEGAGQRHSDVPAAALIELNPVENVCQFMRTSSPRGIFKDYDDTITLRCDARNKLVEQPW